MKLSLLQVRIEGGDRAANRERIEDAIESAAADGADLLALPELWNVGFFASEHYEAAAEPLSGPTFDRMAELAADHEVAIVAGSIIEDLAETRGATPAETGLANTSVVFGPDGRRLATYRKRHLFGYESAEAELLTPGDSLGVAEIGGFTVGITTCYDLRFPELYRELLDAGVTLVVVPSAWPYPRIEHWTTLIRARAVENLFYVAGVNGVGPAGGDAGLIGRSRVVDPWGTAVSAGGTGAETVDAVIDPKRVTDVRERFPALRDRTE
ncbi:MAG: carbon-nitrogen family hydrolase [Halodesulfurarchaeum sp.]